MDEQENINNVTIQPIVKRRGRPAKTVQGGVTVVDDTSITEVKKQDVVSFEEPEKKRGRKSKASLLKDEEIKQLTKHIIKKNKHGRVKIVRRKKAINVFDVIKTFKRPKIKINLSGVKLPKGLTWNDVQIWSVAMAAIVAIALAK